MIKCVNVGRFTNIKVSKMLIFQCYSLFCFSSVFIQFQWNTSLPPGSCNCCHQPSFTLLQWLHITWYLNSLFLQILSLKTNLPDAKKSILTLSNTFFSLFSHPVTLLVPFFAFFFFNYLFHFHLDKTLLSSLKEAVRPQTIAVSSATCDLERIR